MVPSALTQTVKNNGGNTVSSVTYNYTYDSLGNIETVSEGSTLKVKYYYDNLNQLTRENNVYLNKTVTYSYDLGGNLTSVKEYAYQTGATVSGTPTVTNSYTYGDSNWKDKLTAYNGNTITYDQIGNPLTYYNGYSFTWMQGRRLASASNGTNTISYAYNNDGIRIKKTVNNVVTNYTLDGTKVIKETTGSDTIWYYYDESGTPVAFRLNSTLYIYTKNLQGDITGIRNTAGTLLVSYVYDAWGKVTATNVAGTTEGTNLIAKNPYLYRGYRYDAETGLYYLNSRYYDPGTRRFINADGLVSTGQGVLGNNMFAYCRNNPISSIDSKGNRDYSISTMVTDSLSSTIPRNRKEAPQSDYGCAGTFVDTGPGEWDFRNCYTYALGMPLSFGECNPGDISGKTPQQKNDVLDVLKSIRSDVESEGKSFRVLYGANSKVYPDERKIALRVTLSQHPNQMGIWEYDYHLMVQMSDGRWSDKPGSWGTSRPYALGLTPDTISWTYGNEYKYDSPIIYFAIGG